MNTFEKKFEVIYNKMIDMIDNLDNSKEKALLIFTLKSFEAALDFLIKLGVYSEYKKVVSKFYEGFEV